MIKVINKDNLPTSSIEDFEPLQGSLKTLSDENYNKLKKSIEKYGFFVPIFVWNGYIIDGHGRREVIIGEGWDIKVPYINIEAEDVEEAKDKLLHITSQYNTITEDGLQKFNPSWGELSVHFDAISLDKVENYSSKNKELDLNSFENQNYIIKLEFTENEYKFVKDKINQLGHTPEKILYNALTKI